MRMSVSTDGFMDIVLNKAVKLGIAKTKNEALRMGVLSFNKEFNIVKDIELEMVAKKMQQEQELMKKKGQKYIPYDKAMKKYKPLLDELWQKNGI